MASTDSVKQYVLGRNPNEAERLNFQHEIWTANIGFLLHPVISDTPRKADLRVADVGTGTGAFLISLAKDLPPTSQLDGFDISADQFPTGDSSVPNNVSFYEHDLLKPFAAEFLGKYDAVCLRLVAVAIHKEKLDEAIKNLSTLLKPGGHLQWTEATWLKMTELQTEPGASRSALASALKTFNDFLTSSGMAFSDAVEFQEKFKAAGLRAASQDVFSSDRLPETRQGFTQSAVGAVTGGLQHIAGFGGIAWSVDDVKRVRAEAEREIEGGKVYWRTDLVVTVGRKAEEDQPDHD